MKRTVTITRITLGLVLGLALWNAEPNLQAGTKTVTNTADSGAGSLRQTIADAKSGDTIDFRFKDCNPCTITSGGLLINKNLTIQGPGAQLLAVSGGSPVLAIDVGATVTLDGLTIRDGIGFPGGGIYNGGTLTVSNSTVSGNSASLRGGGIVNFGTLTVSNSTVANNSSSLFGGGISNDGTLTVSNSTVSNNSAAFQGGGIANSGMLTVSNSTMSNNEATYEGGGIYLFVLSATINNSIVAGNVVGTTPNDIFGLLTSGSHNLIGDLGSAGGLVDRTNGNIVGVDVNTVLEPLAFNGGPTETHKLLAGSTAVNAGDNALAVDADSNPLPTDQRGPGFRRISGGNVDIGAFELGQGYNFSGFFPPVANPPTLNLARAGVAIPVRFSLGGYQGLDIFMRGYPASQPMGCLDMPSNPVEERVTAGASSLSYDPATDQYTYVWKTDRAWKDCRKLVIKLNDGSTHEAYFQFK